MTITRRAASIAAPALLLSLALTACGGSDATRASAPASSKAPSTQAASTQVSGGKVSAAEVCAVLTKTQPKLDKEKGADGAMVTLALELANLYGAKDALDGMSGADIDTMTRKTCPDARTAALKSAGIASFMQM